MHNKKNYIIIFVFFLAVFVFFSTGHYGGDGLENYLVAKSIVEDGDVTIYDTEFGVKEMRYEKRGEIGRNGKLYSTYGMGIPILLVPLYFFGFCTSFFLRSMHPNYLTQFFVSFSNPLICSIIAIALILLLSELKYSFKVCLITAVVFSFCTMNSVYARSGFSEPAVALCFLLAAFFILRYFNTRLLRYLYISGLCFGYAILIKKSYLIYIICFILTFFIYGYKERSIRKTLTALSAFAIPLSIYMLIILGFNYIRYGGIFITEYGTLSDMAAKGATSQKFFKGFIYFFFSSGKGYFFFNIPLILSLFGILTFCKKHRLFSFLISSIILLNFSFHVYLFDRGTLFSWGPRYLFPTIPFMSIFMADFIYESRRLFRRLTIFLLSAIGFFIQLPCLFINNSRWLFFLKEKVGVSEYMINYVPDLSPIKGVWYMFISLLHNLRFGESLSFIFNPDHRFIPKTEISLSGYDILDIWWFHIIKINPSLTPYVLLSILFLVCVFSYMFFKVMRILQKPKMVVS